MGQDKERQTRDNGPTFLKEPGCQSGKTKDEPPIKYPKAVKRPQVGPTIREKMGVCGLSTKTARNKERIDNRAFLVK